MRSLGYGLVVLLLAVVVGSTIWWLSAPEPVMVDHRRLVMTVPVPQSDLNASVIESLVGDSPLDVTSESQAVVSTGLSRAEQEKIDERVLQSRTSMYAYVGWSEVDSEQIGQFLHTIRGDTITVQQGAQLNEVLVAALDPNEALLTYGVAEIRLPYINPTPPPRDRSQRRTAEEALEASQRYQELYGKRFAEEGERYWAQVDPEARKYYQQMPSPQEMEAMRDWYMENVVKAHQERARQRQASTVALLGGGNQNPFSDPNRSQAGFHRPGSSGTDPAGGDPLTGPTGAQPPGDYLSDSEKAAEHGIYVPGAGEGGRPTIDFYVQQHLAYLERLREVAAQYGTGDPIEFPGR